MAVDADRATTADPALHTAGGTAELRPLTAALAALAGSTTVREVATATVTYLRRAYSARGAALLLRRHGSEDVEIASSTGYACDVMAPGAVLPLHSGLPATESARTGRTVAVGPRAALEWLAVPLGSP